MRIPYLILIYLLIALSVNAQSVQIGIGGGSTIVTGSDFYKNEFSVMLIQTSLHSNEYTFYLQNGLDFNSEYNLNIKTLLNLKNTPFCFSTEISYSSLIGKGTMTIILNPASSYLPPPQKAESSYHILNSCFDVEYELLSKNIIPFLSGGIVLSHLGDIKVKSTENESYQTTIQDGGIRLGLDFGAGIYFKCHSKVVVGISSKYTMNNLVGQKETEEELNTIKTNFNVLFEL
jgi:hypothetical protein